MCPGLLGNFLGFIALEFVDEDPLSNLDFFVIIFLNIAYAPFLMSFSMYNIYTHHIYTHIYIE